jgi:hypothetical protein
MPMAEEQPDKAEQDGGKHPGAHPIAADEPNITAAKESDEEGTPESSDEQRKGGIRGFLQRLTVNEGLTLLVAFATLGVSVRSCQISADQSEMTKAIATLSTLAEQTKRQADVQGDQLNQMAAETNALNEQAGSANQQAQGVAKQADIASKSLIANNRAWLAVSGANLEGSADQLAQPHKVRIYYSNIGNSPATALTMKSQARIALGVKDPGAVSGGPENMCRNTLPHAGEASAFPRLTVPTWQSVEIPAAFFIPDVRDKKVNLILKGCFAYRTTGETHHTAFCYIVAGQHNYSSEGTTACADGNYAD